MIIITTIVMSMIIIMIMTIIVICSPSPLLMRPHRTAGILKALVLNPGANRPVAQNGESFRQELGLSLIHI